jgi:hypothetical protein
VNAKDGPQKYQESAKPSSLRSLHSNVFAENLPDCRLDRILDPTRLPGGDPFGLSGALVIVKISHGACLVQAGTTGKSLCLEAQERETPAAWRPLLPDCNHSERTRDDTWR